MDIALILNIVFYSFFAFTFFGFLYGLIVGIYCTSFTTILKFLLVLIFIFATPSIATAVGNIDLTRFISQTITINGQTINVTTITNTLINILSASNLISPINGMSMYETLLSLSNQIVSVVTFLAIMILIFFLTDIIGAIFYSFTLRFAVKSHDKKKIRKYFENNPESEGTLTKKELNKIKHKGVRRITGAALGAISGFVCISITVAPLSSLVNTFNNATRDLDETKLQQLGNDNVSTFLSYLKQADSSVLMKYYQSFGNFDSAIMNAVTQSYIEGQKVSLISTLEQLLELLGPLADCIKEDANVSEGFTGIIDMTKLVTDTTVSQILDIVAKNNMIIAILPVLINVGLNKVNIDFIDKTELDFSDIDYKNEINLISQVYSKLYQSGLVTSAMENVSEIKIDYSKKSEYVEALKLLGSSQIISKNMAYLIEVGANMVNQSAKTEILQADKSFYENIDWSEELGSLGQIIFDLAESLDIQTLNGDMFNQIFGDWQSLLNNNDNLSALKKAIVGIYEEDGTVLQKGLLDLKFFQNGVDLSNLIVSLVDNISELQQYISPRVLRQLAEKLESDVVNFKDEISMLLDVTPKILELNFESFNLDDEEQVQQVIDILNSVQDSIILNNILPNVLQTMLSNQSSSIFAGIGANNMNFTLDSLISDIVSFLKVYPDIKVLINSFSTSGNLKDQLNNFDLDLASNVLKQLINNKVLNPVQVIGSDNVQYVDYNINTILKNILFNETLQGFGIVVPSNIYSIQWSGEVNTEVDELIAVFRLLKLNVHTLVSDDGNITFSNVNGQLVEDLFEVFANSSLFRPSLASLLNKNLSPILANLGIEFRFSEESVETWINQGVMLAQVLDSLLCVDGVDLANPDSLASIDWANADPLLVNAILTGLYKSGLVGIVVDENGLSHDNLGSLIYEILTKAEMREYFGDNLTKYDFSSVGIDGAVNFEWVTRTEHINLKDIDPTCQTDRVIEITQTGEIAEFVNILREVQKVTVKYTDENDQSVTLKGVEALKSGFARGADVKQVLYSCLNSASLEKSVVGTITNSLSQTSMKIGDNTLSFDNMNLSSFSDYTLEEQKNEIDNLIVLYDFISSRNPTDEEKQYYSDKGLIAPAVTSSMNEIFNNITSLSEKQIDDLNIFLQSLAQSKILTTVKFGGDISFIEQLMSLTLSYTQLDKLIASTDDVEAARIQTEAIIKNIENWSENNEKFMNIILNIQGLDAISSISQPNKLLQQNSIGERYLTSILTSLNECELTHRAVPYLFEKIFNDNIQMNASIQSYLTNIASDVTNKSINFEIGLAYTTENINLIQNDINTIDSSLDQILDDTNSDFDIIEKIKTNREIKPLVELLVNMNVMSFNKEYYIANVLYEIGGNSDIILRTLFDGIAGPDSNILTKYTANNEESYAYSLLRNMFPNNSSNYNVEAVTKIDEILKTI